MGAIGTNSPRGESGHGVQRRTQHRPPVCGRSVGQGFRRGHAHVHRRHRVASPGRNQFSGSHRGATPIGEMFGGVMTVTEGTLALRTTGDPMTNGALVATPVHFSATRNGEEMGMNGVDLLRVEADRIAEVWLFSPLPVSPGTCRVRHVAGAGRVTNPTCTNSSVVLSRVRDVRSNWL